MNKSAILKILLVPAILFYLSSCTTLPDFHSLETPEAGALLAGMPHDHVTWNLQYNTDPYLPVFVMQKQDIENNNEIIGVFFDLSKDFTTWEVTVVFADEDNPSHIKNFFSDRFRILSQKRLADIETFIMSWKPQTGELNSIDFPGTYSRDQQFDDKIIQVYSKKVPGSSFLKDSRSGRPYIFVNTWDHHFSEDDVNETIDAVYIEDYPVFYGNREAVEALYTNAKTSSDNSPKSVVTEK